MSSGFVVLIPARLASTRLARKPLREIAGRAMILHVAERARASGAKALHVATDAEAVRRVCERAGVAVVMTRADHASGSERLAEACDRLGLPDDTVVVNVQGDEPLLPPANVAQVAALLEHDPDAAMASLYHDIHDAADAADPNVVKVVCDARERALYFSRAPIPYHRDAGAGQRQPWACRRHIGIYAYRAGFLRRYVRWAPPPAERLEALEQLRALHHGAVIAMAAAIEEPGPGVDTAQDLARVEALLGAAPLQSPLPRS